METKTFDLPVAVKLRLESRSGDVEVVAESRDDVVVEGDRISGVPVHDDRALQVRAGRGTGKLAVRVPIGTDMSIGTHSGNVRMGGRFGDVSVTTMAGKIELDEADDADLRAMSADVNIGVCSGRVRVSTVSGSISGQSAASVKASTMSGSIRFGRVDGEFMARSVSGSITARCGGEGAVLVKTVSGRVHIDLPEGVEPEARFKTMSGRVKCDCPMGHDVRLEAMSISGSIEVAAG